MPTITLDHLAAQDDFYNAPEDVVAFVAGLGLGKTFTASDWSMMRLLTYPKVASIRDPKPGHFLFSNTYDQLRNGTIRSFLERVEDKWLPANPKLFEWKDRTRDLHEIQFPNLGTSLGVRSVDKPINWKSLEICSAWIDEAQAWPKAAFDMVIGRLRGTATQRKLYPEMPLMARITANPPHTKDHWLYEQCTEPDPITGVPPIRLITGTTFDNPFLTDDYIRRMEAMYDPEIAQAELYGKFIEIGKGRVFRMFNRGKHVLSPRRALELGLPPLEYDPHSPLCWSHDFNLDPLCSILFQWRKVDVARYQRIVMYVLDYMRIESALITNAADELLNRRAALEIARRNGIYLYGDATGASQSNRQTGISDWVALRRRLVEHKLDGQTFKVGSSNPLHRDSAMSANRQLEDANGRIGVVIHERCAPVVTDLERMHWKPGTFDFEIPKAKPGENTVAAKKLTHLGDTFRYPIHHDYPYVEPTPRVGSTSR